MAAAQGRGRTGPMRLYFGCRHARGDYLYEDELAAALEPLEHGDGQGLRADVGPQGAPGRAGRLLHAVDAPPLSVTAAPPSFPPFPTFTAL